MGCPSISAQPSYFQPVPNSGNSSPRPGPLAGLIHQIPLFSLESIPPSVGVAKIYLPDADVRSVPIAPPCATDKEAELPEKLPANTRVLAGAGLSSGLDSMVRKNELALSSKFASTSNCDWDNPPAESTVNVPVETGFPSFTNQPS